MDDLPVKVYTPDSPLAKPLQLLRRMWADLLNSRELAWRLAFRDFKSQYRRSLLGYFWLVATPVIGSLTFIILRESGALQTGETSIPYPAYIFIGTILWQAFGLSMQNPMAKFGANRDMLVKISFPPEALILCAIFSTLLDIGVRLVLLVPILMWYRFEADLSMLLFPVGLLSVIALGTAIGIVMVPISSLYSDVGRALGTFMQFWMFLTPVVIPVAREGFAGVLMRLNPVTYVLDTTRSWLAGVPPEFLDGFFVVVALSVVGLAAGWLLYRLFLPHVIVRMGM